MCSRGTSFQNGPFHSPIGASTKNPWRRACGMQAPGSAAKQVASVVPGGGVGTACEESRRVQGQLGEGTRHPEQGAPAMGACPGGGRAGERGKY